jgi:hypothetical protein
MTTDGQPRVRYVRADVVVGRLERHDIGWLPGHEWFCTTCESKRCRYIHLVRDVAASSQVSA